jgi:hypothetical protein
MRGAIPLLPLYVFMAWPGKILSFISVSIEWLDGGKYRAKKSEKSRGKSEGV